MTSLSKKFGELYNHPNLNGMEAEQHAFLERVQHESERGIDLEGHRVLFQIYHTSIASPAPGDGVNQHHPFVARVRMYLESVWMRDLAERAKSVVPEYITAESIGPIIRHLVEAQSCENHHLFEMLQAYGCKAIEEFWKLEGGIGVLFGDLIALSIPGSRGKIASSLIENLVDEHGDCHSSDHVSWFLRLVGQTDPAKVLQDALNEYDARAYGGLNLLSYFAQTRSRYYYYLGAMGAAELADPPLQKRHAHMGKAFGYSEESLQYYIDHAELDVEHGEAWIRDAIGEAINKHPGIGHQIVMGAAMRGLTLMDYYDFAAEHLDRKFGRTH